VSLGGLVGESPCQRFDQSHRKPAALAHHEDHDFEFRSETAQPSRGRRGADQRPAPPMHRTVISAVGGRR